MKIWRTFLIVLFLLTVGAKRDFVDLQLNSSADFGQGYGYSDTIPGNSIYNAYLSQTNGASFLNSGDGASTLIHLPTSTVGTFTYQFYYTNAFANQLTLQLWAGDRTLAAPNIVMSTQRDSAATSFTATFDPATAPPFAYPYGTPPGSSMIVIDGYAITLTEFEFTNGTGPATAFDVTSGLANSPEIFGHFTYDVSVASTPVPPVVCGGVALLGSIALPKLIRTRRG